MSAIATTVRTNSTQKISSDVALTERDKTIIRKRMNEKLLTEKQFRTKMQKRFGVGA